MYSKLFPLTSDKAGTQQVIFQLQGILEASAPEDLLHLRQLFKRHLKEGRLY